MAVAVCPKPEILGAFARGDLAPEMLATVAEHVGVCSACAAALRFVPEDSLANLARAAAASPNTAKSVAETPLPAKQVGAKDAIPAGFADHPRYRILSEIGAGGMGTVYKAEDQLMGRTIAIKVVSPHLTAKASAVERFRKEIRAAAQLNHPSVITAHDTGEAGGSHFLVMEFIEGVSLDRLVAKKGQLPVPMACTFTRQAALGLQHAADKGMVHRDIKPQNLMVTRKGQVKILDFGLARFARTDENEVDAMPTMKLPFGAAKPPVDAGVTNPNMLMGTPDYLSPEQAKNSHDVDSRSDIYSLGCTLYYLLTGHAPFSGATTLIDKLLAHTHEAPPPLRDERPEVPDGLVEVLEKMLAKNPADRYQTAAEAASALLPYTRSDSAKEPNYEIVDAVVVTPAPLNAMAQTVPLATDTPASGSATLAALVNKPKRVKKSRRAKWWKRNKRKVLAGAGLFLLLLVVLANRGKRNDAKQPDPDAVAKANNTNTNNPTTPQGKEKGTKGANPWGQGGTLITPPGKGVQVLYVLPSRGLWTPDYKDTRDRLEAKGAKVWAASFDGKDSLPHHEMKGPPVPVDKFFRADMDLTDYSAIVFTGADTSDYIRSGRASAATQSVISKMQSSGKVVAAICVGQSVLGSHEVLRGKRAAHCPPLFNNFGWLENPGSSIKWEKRGVVTDGKVVTAAGPEHASDFADAILKVIDDK